MCTQIKYVDGQSSKRKIGTCYVCNRGPARMERDHCHTHGWVRGKVCTRCNRLMTIIDAGLLPTASALSHGATVGGLIAHAARCRECESIDPSNLDARNLEQRQRDERAAGRATLVSSPTTGATDDPTGREALFDSKKVAGIFKISPRTLERWVAQGIGPRPIRLDSGQLRWSKEVILRYIAERQTAGRETEAAA